MTASTTTATATRTTASAGISSTATRLVFSMPGPAEDTHGTHVAGTIAAGRHNGGVAGITGSDHVKIMVLQGPGHLPGQWAAPEDVVAAIRYAEANGASICNLSFCSGVYCQELADTIQNSGMLFVVAAGNGDEKRHRRGHRLRFPHLPGQPALRQRHHRLQPDV